MPEIKTHAEIQRAHDVLHAIVNDEVPIAIRDDVREQMLVALSVLCWALGHKNDVFAVNLQKCEEKIAETGRLVDTHKPDTVH